MQNRGLVKFFAILFALVCIYQLTFTFVAHNVEQDAKAFANGDSQKELKYLDSIGKIEVLNMGFTSFTYNEVRDKKINKGLDLEGGINVQLQISMRDILKGLANDSQNAAFNKALDAASKNRKGNEDYVDVFFREFANVSGGTKLASPDIFGNKALSDEVNFKMTDAEVEKVIRRKVDESVTSAFEVLAKRIDKFGVVQPNIQRLGQSGRILVELPGAKDVDRIKKLLQSTAQLEFWETYKIEEMGNFLLAANEALKTSVKDEVKTAETAPAQGIDSLLVDKKSDSTAVTKGNNPLLEKFIAQGGGPVLAVVAPKDTAVINGYLKRPEIRNLLPVDMRYAKFVWGIAQNNYTDDKQNRVEGIELYALKGNRSGKAAMSGGVVTDARDSFDQLGKPSVSMQMSGAGAKAWEELTGKAYTEKGYIAIVLDNVVYSAPGVSSGPISGGRSEISGSFDITQTKDLANVLRAGKLPAAAEIVQSEVVGPSLGQEAIDNGTTSAIVGLLVVALWMMVYYGRAGSYANIALLVNLLFLFGALASLGAVLTLPGIAGIVLTLGTAVDANIIIYERAKEELAAGKSQAEAIDSAFGWKGAMRPIVDANVTHVLTGAVLYIFGTGPIQGFATTLLIGIITSMFSAIFVTRILLDWGLKRGHKLSFDTSFSKNFFKNFNYDFLGKKKIAYALSAVIVVVCVVSLFTNGLNQGVDFKGGRTFQVRFEKPVSAEEVREELAPLLDGSAEAKIFGGDNQLKITTKFKVDETGEEADQEVNRVLYEGLKKHYGPDMTYEKFVTLYDGKTLGILQGSKVSATVSDDIKTNAYWAVLGAMAIVFLYLAISFRKWQYSLGAIAAIAHDVIFVLGIYSLLWKYMPFGMEVDQHFIAAILTVIGYSMNDTVIVFDRVREYLAGKAKGNFNDIVNQSINATMSRTINTSLTLIFVLLVMFIWGGESIRGFIFAMLIGMIVGTYSSLFIATPVLCDTIPDSEHKRIEEEHRRANEEA
jgi:SecD/SecF fusion protein